MTLTLELGGIRDPMVRRALEVLAQQFPVPVTGGGAPSGPAGGVLAGTYPDPGFAADMATQAELDTHTGLTTTAHGGIVASTDPRLTDARTPTAHKTSHEPGGTDALTGLTNASIAAAAAIAKTKLANLDIVNADVNAAAAIAEAKLNLATDAAAGTGSRRTLGTTATSAAAGNRGLPAAGTTGEVLTKNSATDYDASWAAASGGGTPAQTGAFSAYRNAALTIADGAVVVFDTEEFDISSWFDTATGRFTPKVAGVYRLNWSVRANAVQSADTFWQANLRKNGAIVKATPPIWQRAAVTPVGNAGTALVQANGSTDFFDVVWSQGGAASQAILNSSLHTFFQGEFVNGGTPTWTAAVKQAADVTNATTTNADTDLVFTFEANSTYVIDLYLIATAAATTTGFAFAFDTSVAVTVNSLTFEHNLATAGTLTGGDAIADDTVRGLSSGVPTAATLVPTLGNGLIVTGASTGTCRLRFRPEVAASATFKAGSAMRVMKVP